MSENKAKVKANLIPKPLQRAFYAGLSAGGFSLVFGVPAEYTWKVSIFFASYSALTTALDMGNSKRNRRRNGRRVLLNGRTIDLEYSINQGRFITRETWGDTITRWIYGKDTTLTTITQTKPELDVSRPEELDEFVFISKGMQLRECHVNLFLKSAWRNRKYGRGLGERRWVREFSQRPAWYQELSTDWYYAAMWLLADCQRGLNRQMIIYGENNWLDLANEPFLTMRLLKWYESERRK